MGSKTRSDCLCFIDNPPSCIKKFLTRNGRSRAAIGAFEERRPQLSFETAKAPAERRLSDTEFFRSLP